MIPFTQNSRKCKFIQSGRKQIYGCLRTVTAERMCVLPVGHKQRVHDEDVHYLDYG